MANELILLVDDEQLNLEILNVYMQEAGYESVAVDNGAAAWDALCAQPERISAVLLDRMMPGEDGLSLLRRIKC